MQTSTHWNNADQYALEQFRSVRTGTMQTSTHWNNADQYALEECRPVRNGTMQTSTQWNNADQYALEQCRPVRTGTMQISTHWNNADQYALEQCRPVGTGTMQISTHWNNADHPSPRMPSNSGVYLVSAQFHPSKDGLPYSKEEESRAYDNSVTTYDEINVKMTDADEPGAPFRGMGKEELLKHSSKPLWTRLRMICISIVLLGWLALLVTVVALVLIYPRCRPADARAWWQKEVIYRVYVQSFKDSDGNGVGDLKGVESKLDYIKNLGFNTISLSPFFQSDGFDSDFNIINHKEVDTRYGNLDQFKSLIKAAHDKGMYLILDFIPNHASDKHDWFIKSRESSAHKNLYRNFYVWTDATSVSNWNAYDYYNHTLTYALPEVSDMLSRWTSLVMDFGKQNKTEKFFMADIKGDITQIMNYYGMFGRDGVHIAANLDFMDKTSCDGDCINTFSGNEDSSRFGSRFSESYMKAFNMLMMLLPGTPIVYYGDEINMQNLKSISSPGAWSQRQVMRGLMLWNNDTDGGFQSGVTCPALGCLMPWIDVQDSNATAEYQQATTGSMLNMMKNLTKLRQHDSFVYGYYARALQNKNVFSFILGGN
ncbi:hypothetical protein KUTeg_015483 [Tegillarca granosa]|uniref:Glycosyl hydrolase family 13 catalytic domain-containing protein n=1 Tax=Tegillarca granosa TaxID=220873 RepID=A0ABQ9EQA3_TEGGR|nr:hypothetical protein KUTeg_015483 [Tegillarca granosa]